MRKIQLVVSILVLFIIPMASLTGTVMANGTVIRPPRAPTLGKAVILSSLNKDFPLGYYEKYMILRLSQAGYSTTVLTDNNVTVDFLVNQLNNYDIVIWRTDIYTWSHVEYFYVGEMVNGATEQKYAADFSQGWINANAGILGVTPNFLSEHLGNNSLSNVKLMIIEGSNSVDIAPTFITAGATSVIYCNGLINLDYGLMDDLTSNLLDYLCSGENVYSAVFNSVNYLNNQAGLQSQLRSNIDDAYIPPFWFLGSSSLTIISST